MSSWSSSWRRTARITAEMLALFGGLALIDWLWAGWSGFDGLQPSPWWLPVLVMSLAYGTVPGVIAAAGATALWLQHEHRVIAGEDYLDQLFRLSLPALFWFVVAVVVGETTQLRAARERRQRRQAETGHRNVARLSAAFEALAETNRALQAAVARDEATVGHIVAAAAGLTSASPAEREAAILHLTSVAAATRNFTLYRVRDGEAWSWLRGAEAQAGPETLPAQVRLALQGRTSPLTVARPADREPLTGLGVACVPLRGHATAAPIAYLVVHHLDFSELNAYRMAELAQLSAWLAPVLDAPALATAADRAA